MRSPPLTPELVLAAYREGFFPMADARGAIRWYSPDPRGIFEVDTFRAARSVRQRLRRGEFEVRINTAFADVLAACATEHGESWISSRIARVYQQLFEDGHAHSVEAWHGGELVGGLYGVAIGGAFFGESMFHRRTDASKVALTALIDRMRSLGLTLLDTQWTTPHLVSLGAIDIPREEYLERLRAALALKVRFQT